MQEAGSEGKAKAIESIRHNRKKISDVRRVEDGREAKHEAPPRWKANSHLKKISDEEQETEKETLVV